MPRSGPAYCICRSPDTAPPTTPTGRRHGPAPPLCSGSWQDGSEYLAGPGWSDWPPDRRGACVLGPRPRVSGTVPRCPGYGGWPPARRMGSAPYGWPPPAWRRQSPRFATHSSRRQWPMPWLPVLSTNWLTAYFPHPKRGVEALDAFGLLSQFMGVLVHDHWSCLRALPMFACLLQCSSSARADRHR